jgi:hypothetical protein
MSGEIRKLILLFVVAISLSSIAQALESESRACITPENRIKDTSPYEGYDFLTWNYLDMVQQNLVQTDVQYTSMTIGENGKATNFLALTQALSQTTLKIGEKEIRALDLIQEIKEIRTDRIFVILDQSLVKEWRNSGGFYAMALARGKSEVGHVGFFDHNTKDAGLHCGFDLQWYTDPSKAPHLHWNMRLIDGYGDIHLDGYKGWYFEVIPNYKHLTYANSDVRYWFDKFKKKYGVPKFLVRKEIKK